jgi:hypothetical protein
MTSAQQPCKITAVGKRRDGGTRYWCLVHKADATAKYGKRGRRCRAAHIPEVSPKETLTLNLDDYPGGVALWGAVPAIYDTTSLPMDRGIHVHTRRVTGASKEIDNTFRAVRLLGSPLPAEGVLISEIDAIYYMVAIVLGFEMKSVLCTLCNYPHLDRDWFTIHPHRRHLCAGCGRHFRDTSVAVGNPICGIREAYSLKTLKPKRAKASLNIRQRDYPGGIQIWGSNPAIVWTSDLPEDEGIHIHGYRSSNSEPDFDETFGSVCIDGVKLDPQMVRVYMAQTVLPHLKGRIASVSCPSCGRTQFRRGLAAVTPVVRQECDSCGHQFAARRALRKCIANPMSTLLEALAQHSPRRSQQHQLDLVPETL